MNEFTKIFSDLTDSELETIIREVKELDETGILYSGKTRELIKKTEKATGESGYMMKITIDLVFKEYAYRNLNLK